MGAVEGQALVLLQGGVDLASLPQLGSELLPSYFGGHHLLPVFLVLASVLVPLPSLALRGWDEESGVAFSRTCPDWVNVLPAGWRGWGFLAGGMRSPSLSYQRTTHDLAGHDHQHEEGQRGRLEPTQRSTRAGRFIGYAVRMRWVGRIALPAHPAPGGDPQQAAPA
jgi:hypothetical protein